MAVPQGFKPSLSPQQVTNYRQLYDRQPEQFDDQTLEALEQHAEYYKLPFSTSSEHFLGKTGEVMKQLGSGFVSGFTTFNVGDPPEDDAEAIARNIGHLAGFVGFLPSTPFKMARMPMLAKAAQSLKGRSVPMVIANYATKKAGKLSGAVYGKAIGARADAAKTAVGFLQNNVVKDMASGAFHLGVASAVSSWQGGVDEMLDSFIHGAETGAVFRGIGNLIQTGAPTADKALRTLSSSLYTGLPSTARGETTPMQIYQYLLGGYFGYNEMPVHRRMGAKHLSKMLKKGEQDPELVAGWDKIDKPGQDWVIKKAKAAFEPENALAAEIIKAIPGIDPKEAEARAQEFIKSQKEKESIHFTEEGEPVRDYTEEELREMDLSGEDVDPQIKPAQLSINAKTFVDRNMEKYLEGRPIGEKLLIAKGLNDEWTRLLKAERKTKTGVNPGDAMSKHILEKHPEFSQLEEDYSFWRNLGYMRIRQRPVNMITITNGKARVMSLDENGVAQNDAGNKKQLSQEPKVIEEVWLEDWNRKVGGTEKEAYGVYAILDHMVRSTPIGMREFDLGKYTDYLAKRNAAKHHREFPTEEDNNAAKAQYDKEIGSLMKFMDHKKKLIVDSEGNPVIKNNQKQYYKHDMYYYGGRADAERMYFVKYHPDVSRNPRRIKKDLAFIRDTLKKEGVPEEDLKAIDKSRAAFIKRYGEGIGGKSTRIGAKTRLSKTSGISVMRDSKYGNPFIVPSVYDKNPSFYAKKGYVRALNRKEAIERYDQWLRNQGDVGYLPSKRNAILADIKAGKLSGETLRYFKPEASDSHAVRLSKLIDEMSQRGLVEDRTAGDIFDRSFISNVLYDIRLNGYGGLSDFNKVLKKGYVNNAKGFNKRAQIWLTSGYSADPKAVALRVAEARGGKKGIENESFNIQLIEDLGEEINHQVGSPSSKHFEVTDGGVIGRSDAIDGLNYGAGLPLEGGVNKSFIVSPNPQLGALLGKYMIHSASPKLEKYMQDNNIHLIIPKSAAKQIGQRKVGNISWVRKRPKVDAEVYELPIKDIKVVMSEKTDKHSIESQHMPKQMFMNFTPYAFFDPSRAPFKNAKEYNEAMGEIMDDMYETLSGNRAAGEEEFNTMVQKLAENPSAYEGDIPKILNNLDKVGIHELLGSIKKPGNELFANQVYAKIQKYNRDVIEDMRAEGEYTDTELKQMKDEMANYVIVHDRIQKLVPRSIAGFLHKYSRDYRMSVIRNYIVNGITRPKIGNSGSTRMRPYEIGMSKEGPTAALEKRDDIFFLDDGFRELDIDVTGIGKTGKRKLGKLWDDYQLSLKKKGAKKDKQLEELFRAILVRVPMDSMSGAHALHFKGFTGIRGFGSLLHGRTMKALGGADLDGDKAFVFFGGRAADGTGEGFKKDWKDAYNWSKNEYVSQPTTLKPLMLRKVISGFQDHADLEGVRAAKEEGYETGGTSPYEFQSKSGKHPEYAKLYNAEEVTDAITKAYTFGREKFYGPRTEQNVLNSDGTVLFGDVTSPGSKLTLNLAKSHGRPHIVNPTPFELRKWLGEEGIETLNVAGNARTPAGKAAYKTIKDLKNVKDLPKGKPIEEDNKRAINPFTGKTYHSELTVQPDETTGEDIVYDLGKNKALQYDPVSRQTASNAASEGRGQLKTAVVQSGTIRSAYAAIRATENSTVYVKIHMKDFPSPLTMRVRALKGDKNLRAFRGLTRAAVGLASDPMDEAGLRFGKRGNDLLEKQTDALFEYKIIDGRHLVRGKQNPNFRKPVHRYDKLIKPHHKRSAVINLMKDVNQGLYSRNFSENRRFHMWEIHERLEGINDPESGLSPEQRNTFLPKLANDIQGLDWSDGVLQRLKESNLDSLYAEHDANLKSYDWLRDILGRESMAVPMSAYYKLAMRYKLYTKEGMEAQLDAEHPRYNRDILVGEPFKFYNKNKFDEFDRDSMEQRSRHLNDLVTKAEDFIINDLSDMASIKQILKKAKNISNSRVKEISEQADFLKKNSYILGNRAKKIDKENSSLDQYEISFLEAAHEKIYGEKQSAALNQMEIDKRIEQYKELITPEEADLFDALMLGTLWRGRKFDKEAFFKDHGPPKSDRAAKDLEDMISDSKKTTLSRIGFASSSVTDASVRGMLKEYSKLFDYTIDVPDVKAAETFKKAAEELDAPKPFLDANGERIEGMVVENPEKDASTQKYFDEYAPFIGLHEGKLSKEASEIAYEIKDHLEHYNNIVGKDLNGIFRWLLQKDINKGSLEDFKTLNRWFKMTRDGTWWQRMMRPVKDKSATISRWHHLMFPKAIGQDLMRYDLQLVEARAPYKDKYGWVHGRVVQPDNMMTKMQSAVHSMQQQSTQMYEEEKEIFDADMRPYLEGIPDGAELFRVAIRLREFKYATSPEFKDRFKGEKGTFNAFSKEYINRWNEIQKAYNWETLKEKIYDVPVEGGKVIKLTGDQVVRNINKIVTKWNKKVHGWMTGERDIFGQNEWQRSYSPLKGKYKNYAGDFHIVEKFLKKFDDAAVKGERVLLSEGIDGLREIAKSQMIAETPKRHSAIKENINLKLEIEETGDLGSEGYWPHVAGDRKLAAKGIEDLIKTLDADHFMDKKTKLKELTKAIYHYKQVTGDWMPNSEINEPYEQAFNVLREINTKQQKKGEGVSWFTSIRKVGSQHSRNAHIPGWSVEPEVYSNYMKGVIDNMHKHAAQIKVRSDIYRFAGDHHKKTGDWAHTFDWVDFFNLYAQDALGYPQRIPDRVLNNDSMKIKGTPYAWWNDSNVKRRVNQIRSTLGIGAKKEAGLPEELKGIDFGVLAKWGNLEAKYELASLLAHPKSAVANLYGGTVHTLASTGMENYLNGRNIRFLQSNVNPEWKNMTDVQEWVYKLGVVEDFLIYEAGLNPKFKGKKWKEFFTEATGKLKKDPQLADVELRSIAKKHGITDAIFNKAAWFMRRPERTLRRDAFMAHYLQARGNFEGAITRYDDPILIKIAREGVKSTQFLYSAPFRPAFARSSMGKVMTRFQLWAWNSVRFRNQVLKEAALRGWKEGTEEFDRFKRVATLDLLMMGLSSVFMYSLFENALPAPWNWLQDFADWAFGNKRERSRAFFGSWPEAVAPLQMITPPIARLLPPLFKAMVTGDYDRLSGYYVASMFPFGRMGYDVFGEGGLVDNPMRSIEKITGLPYMQFAREYQKEKEIIKPKGFLSLIGNVPS